MIRDVSALLSVVSDVAVVVSARRHVAIMLPPSDSSLQNRSAAGRVSLSSHAELHAPTEDDCASVDAVVSADSRQLVM